jgi:hypothetical protein
LQLLSSICARRAGFSHRGSPACDVSHRGRGLWSLSLAFVMKLPRRIARAAVAGLGTGVALANFWGWTVAVVIWCLTVWKMVRDTYLSRYRIWLDDEAVSVSVGGRPAVAIRCCAVIAVRQVDFQRPFTLRRALTLSQDLYIFARDEEILFPLGALDMTERLELRSRLATRIPVHAFLRDLRSPLAWAEEQEAQRLVQGQSFRRALEHYQSAATSWARSATPLAKYGARPTLLLA